MSDVCDVLEDSQSAGPAQLLKVLGDPTAAQDMTPCTGVYLQFPWPGNTR